MLKTKPETADRLFFPDCFLLPICILILRKITIKGSKSKEEEGKDIKRRKVNIHIESKMKARKTEKVDTGQ